MKKYILVLVTLFSLISICNAEEFKTDKRFDADTLCKEIQLSTGLVLMGINQIGYMSTKELHNDDYSLVDGTIMIKLKDRDLTADEKAKINNAIKKHIYVDPEVIEKAKKDRIKAKLKASGMDDETVEQIVK